MATAPPTHLQGRREKAPKTGWGECQANHQRRYGIVKAKPTSASDLAESICCAWAGSASAQPLADESILAGRNNKADKRQGEEETPGCFQTRFIGQGQTNNGREKKPTAVFDVGSLFSRLCFARKLSEETWIQHSRTTCAWVCAAGFRVSGMTTHVAGDPTPSITPLPKQTNPAICIHASY